MIDILRQIGLQEKEALAYKTLLQTGTVPASVIATRLKFPRSTAKFICDQLVQKSLASQTIKGNATLYTPEPPKKLQYLLNQEKAQLNEKESQLNQILPKLEHLMNPYSVMPKVQFYEGSEGIITMLRKLSQTMQPKTELLSFAKIMEESKRTSLHELWQALRKFEKDRARKNIWLRTLVLKSPESEALQTYATETLQKVKTVDLETLNLNFTGGQILIYADTCYIMSWQKDLSFGYTVQSSSVSMLYRGLFEAAWH